MMQRRHYTEEERAIAQAAYEANAKNLDKTARYCQIPRNTLRHWIEGGATNPQTSKLRQQKKDDLAAALEEIAWKCVEALPAKIEEGNLKDIAVTMGVSIEKCNLLRGKATERQEITGADGEPISLQHTFEELRQLPPDELVRKYRDSLGASAEGSRTS